MTRASLLDVLQRLFPQCLQLIFATPTSSSDLRVEMGWFVKLDIEESLSYRIRKYYRRLRLDHRYKSWLSCFIYRLSIIHISEPTRLRMISYAVFCLKKKKWRKIKNAKSLLTVTVWYNLTYVKNLFAPSVLENIANGKQYSKTVGVWHPDVNKKKNMDNKNSRTG